MTSFVRLFKNAALLSLCFVASVFADEKVYLAPIAVNGLHEDYALASAKLMKAHMDAEGRYVLILGTSEDSVGTDNQARIEQVAKEKKCTKYIVASFSRTGENVMLSFKLYNVGNGRPVWSVAPKAETPDDFEAIIENVSKIIGTQKKSDDIAPKKAKEDYSVPETQNYAMTPKEPTTFFGVAICGFLPLNPIVEMDAGYSIYMLHDAGTFLYTLDFNWYGMSSESNLKYYDFGITMDYAFSAKLFTPFAGFGFSYSVNRYNYDGVDEYSYAHNYSTSEDKGLTGFLDGGIMFNRKSHVVVTLRAKYICNLYRTASYDIVKSNKTGLDIVRRKSLIHGPAFNLGMAYGF